VDADQQAQIAKDTGVAKHRPDLRRVFTRSSHPMERCWAPSARARCVIALDFTLIDKRKQLIGLARPLQPSECSACRIDRTPTIARSSSALCARIRR